MRRMRNHGMNDCGQKIRRPSIKFHLPNCRHQVPATEVAAEENASVGGEFDPVAPSVAAELTYAGAVPIAATKPARHTQDMPIVSRMDTSCGSFSVRASPTTFQARQ